MEQLLPTLRQVVEGFNLGETIEQIRERFKPSDINRETTGLQ